MEWGPYANYFIDATHHWAHFYGLIAIYWGNYVLTAIAVNRESGQNRNVFGRYICWQEKYAFDQFAGFPTTVDNNNNNSNNNDNDNDNYNDNDNDDNENSVRQS